MEEHRPEMTTLLMKALNRKIGDTAVGAAINEAAAKYAALHCGGHNPSLNTIYLAKDTMRRLPEKPPLENCIASSRQSVAPWVQQHIYILLQT